MSERCRGTPGPLSLSLLHPLPLSPFTLPVALSFISLCLSVFKARVRGGLIIQMVFSQFPWRLHCCNAGNGKMADSHLPRGSLTVNSKTQRLNQCRCLRASINILTGLKLHQQVVMVVSRCSLGFH